MLSLIYEFDDHIEVCGWLCRAHMIVSPLVAWHEVEDMWHELRDIVVHSLSRSTSYARQAELVCLKSATDTCFQQVYFMFMLDL